MMVLCVCVCVCKRERASVCIGAFHLLCSLHTVSPPQKSKTQLELALHTLSVHRLADFARCMCACVYNISVPLYIELGSQAQTQTQCTAASAVLFLEY